MLTDQQVRAMRQCKDRGATYPEVAERFGVSRSTAWDVCSGRRHGSIGGPIAETCRRSRYRRAPIMQAAHLGLSWFAAKMYEAEVER